MDQGGLWGHRALDLLEELGGTAEPVRRALGAASTDAPVLILGEVGTGKLELARAIHRRSSRAHGPLHIVDCGALAVLTLERELFGYQAGHGIGGVWARSCGGTLVLQSFCHLSLATQHRLLELLRNAPSDVRVIACDDRSLAQEVRDGRLRRELVEALSVVSVVLPPLRERTEDLPALAQRVLTRIQDGASAVQLSSEALHALVGWQFPSNLASLITALEHAAACSAGGLIQVGDLPEVVRKSGAVTVKINTSLADLPYRDAKELALEEFEDMYFTTLLERASGNVSEAARQAGLDRSNFRRALRRASSRASAPGRPQVAKAGLKSKGMHQNPGPVSTTGQAMGRRESGHHGLGAQSPGEAGTVPHAPWSARRA